MSKEPKLKPCPFCGSEGRIHRVLSFGTNAYYPRCRTEDCVGNNGWVSFETKAEAVKAWNRRPK
ncbi:MAG: Lar family restriction alleviation protein [Candidatus Thorarchaeota archaeon]|jgi:Lar family restriction alleviation protein